MTDFINCKNIEDFCACIKTNIANLNSVLYGRDIHGEGTERFYESFEIQKKNGKTRTISAPKGPLLVLQKDILSVLEKADKFEKSKSVSYAFKKGTGILDHASVHRNKKIIVKVDLKDFFDSFSFNRIWGFLQKDTRFKLSENLSRILATLLCYQEKLPQGAPTSPIMTNLIAKILDSKILKLTPKYKLQYSRYADDLTFSTNDWNFKDKCTTFLEELNEVIKNANFKINEEKTKIKFYHQRQIVTGLVVNNKINIPRSYYRNTRAMADSLYKNRSFTINGEPGTIEQLNGRFSFIDQIDRYNNQKLSPTTHQTLNYREKDYRKFLTFIFFLNNKNPLICGEGKTDIPYLRAALKGNYIKYPKLITRKTDDTFNYKIDFFNKSKKINYLYKTPNGGDSTLQLLKEIRIDLKHFKDKYGLELEAPFFLMLDNELENKNKPIKKFVNSIHLSPEKISNLKEHYIVKIDNDLPIFLITTPLVKGLSECEIEDLFDDETLATLLKGKKLNRNSSTNKDGGYSKTAFAKYITNNYTKIDFSNFKPIFDNIVKIIDEFTPSKIKNN